MPKEGGVHSTEELRYSLSMVTKSHGNVWVLGDFNYPKFSWDADHVPSINYSELFIMALYCYKMHVISNAKIKFPFKRKGLTSHNVKFLKWLLENYNGQFKLDNNSTILHLF